MTDYSLGFRFPVSEWVNLNKTAVFNEPDLRKYVGPFPPVELMENTTGLTKE